MLFSVFFFPFEGEGRHLGRTKLEYVVFYHVLNRLGWTMGVDLLVVHSNLHDGFEGLFSIHFDAVELGSLLPLRFARAVNFFQFLDGLAKAFLEVASDTISESAFTKFQEDAFPLFLCQLAAPIIEICEGFEKFLHIVTRRVNMEVLWESSPQVSGDARGDLALCSS